MSYTRKPNIRLAVHKSWFNLLISALAENIKVIDFPNTVENAAALINKLMKYSRPYTDAETNIDCVDIRFFPNEASEMIWQLLMVCGVYVEVVDDFYLPLIENHIPKEPKKQTE